jgi:WD40 repeat protein/serine/threonine protein kinase
VTPKGRDAKSQTDGTEPSSKGNCLETRTYPFSESGNAGDVRGAALKIRRFEILDEIGRGGHGVVFRANDRVLRRLVALKLPRPEVLRSKEMRRRFVAEAQVVAALDHPNIIKVYDAGFESAVCYIAQELCNGPSLAKWLTEQPAKIPADVAAWVLLGLARGLEHAHRQNVLHRDLKPANVLLKPHFGDSPDEVLEGLSDPGMSGIFKVFPYTPKLGDFGICKAFDFDTEMTGTRTGLVLGTASYMAPEQAVGTASELGPQSDIYSLGAILYEMLTGQPPFRGMSSADVLKQVLVDPPVSVRATRRDVPAELDAICLKCLEKLPTERYATAAELADDLHRFLAGEPVRAPRKSFLYRFARTIGLPKRSIRLSFALSGWVLVLLMLGLYLRAPKGTRDWADASVAGSEAAVMADVHSAFNLWHENAERLRDNPNVGDEMTALLERHKPKPGDVDRRGFGWHYAWRLCHPAESVGTLNRIATFKAHPSDVFFVAFSRDGSRFATAGGDGTARVWNAKTREPICVCKGHKGDVNWVDFSVDQRLLATASEDHDVKIWDAATGKELFTLPGHRSEVVAVRFSPVGNVIVSGDHQGMLNLWDLTTRKLIKSVPAHAKRIESLAWGMNGYMLASVGNDNTIRLWEMPGMVSRSERETTESQCASFSPVANLIACGGGGTIHIDDVHSGGCYATFSDHFDHIESIAFSPDGRQLASCDGHGLLRLWDVASRRGWQAAPIRRHTQPNGEVVGVGLWCVAYSPDGTQLVTSARDGVVDVWDASNTPQWTTVTRCESAQSAIPLAFSPDGKQLAVARRCTKHVDDRLQIWDVSLAQSKLVRDFPGVTGHAACFSRNGKQLVVGMPGKVEVFDPHTGESRLKIPLAGETVASFVTFDAHGSLVVLENGAKNSAIDVFDPETGTKLRSITDPYFAASGVHESGFSVSADGNLSAVAARGSQLTALCQISAGSLLPNRLGERGGTGALQFSPVGNLLAIGSCGGVELWDPQTGKEQAFLSGLGRDVGPLAFSADGRLLIVVSRQLRAVQLWDVKDRNPLFTLPLPADAAAHAADWHLAVAPDGKQIACSLWSSDGTGGIYLFSGTPAELAVRDDSSVALGEPNPDGRD